MGRKRQINLFKKKPYFFLDSYEMVNGCNSDSTLSHMQEEIMDEFGINEVPVLYYHQGFSTEFYMNQFLAWTFGQNTKSRFLTDLA